MSNAGPDQPRPELPPPPPPPRPGRRRLAILATSGIVILALVVVGLVYLLNRDDGETPTAGAEAGGSADDGSAGEQGATDPTDDATDTPPEPTGWTMPGESIETWDYTQAVWVTDDALIHATNAYVSSTDRLTGEVLWSVQAPQIEGLEDSQINYCGASTNVQDGMVALAFGPDVGNGANACALLQVIDTSTGEEVWGAEVAEPNEFDDSYPDNISVEIIDGTVVASWSVIYDNTMVGYDLAEGTEQWRTTVGEDVFDAPRCEFEDVGTAGGSAIITGLCDADDGSTDRQLAFARIDPATGSVSDARAIPRDELGFSIANQDFISLEPLIVRGTNSDRQGEGGDHMVVVDNSFQVSSAIAAADGHSLAAVTDGDENRAYPAVTVDRDTGVLVAVSATAPDSEEIKTELVAYDLTSGEPVWSTGFDNAVVRAPIGVGGGNLLAWVTEGDRGHRIATLDLATGDVADAGAPLPAGEDFYAGLAGAKQSVRYLSADGWVYAVRTKPGDSSSDVIAVPHEGL